MTRRNRIISALREQIYALSDVSEKELHPLGKNSYHLNTFPPYFLKWVATDDKLGQNEIEINQTLLKNIGIAVPKFIGVASLSDGKIGCWEWLEGNDLRYQREKLPEAFALIGDFHKKYRHHGEVYSLISHRAYKSIEALLEDDADFLCRQYDILVCSKIKDNFSQLRVGYSTYIHGDFHPGNIFLARNELKVIDWGFCVNSLNLFDLSYVETQPPCRKEWWRIRCDEAEDVLSEYYKAAGLEQIDFRSVHRPIMLWVELWAYYNGRINGFVEETEMSKQRIEQLLEKS